jgi:hypothetical protein
MCIHMHQLANRCSIVSGDLAGITG